MWPENQTVSYVTVYSHDNRKQPSEILSWNSLPCCFFWRIRLSKSEQDCCCLMQRYMFYSRSDSACFYILRVKLVLYCVSHYCRVLIKPRVAVFSILSALLMLACTRSSRLRRLYHCLLRNQDVLFIKSKLNSKTILFLRAILNENGNFEIP